MKLSIQVSLLLLSRKALRVCLLFTCCLLSTISIGQNLVNNGSFEAISNCNFSYTDIDTVIGWWGVQSPDLFNSCSILPDFNVPSNVYGSQPAFDGNGYVFFASYSEPFGSDFREYVQTKLFDTLLSDSRYYLTLMVSFTDDFQYTSDGIGAFLSMDTVYGAGLSQIIDSIPQVQVPNGVPIVDKTNWVLVDGCFIAKGGESFLTIGNFKHDSDLTIQSLGGTSIFGGYYLDDVQLHEIPAFKSDSNHFICNGIIDSTFLDLSDTSEVTTYSWFPTNGLTNPTLPQTWAKPSVTTTYTLSQYTPCDTTTIDVTVYVDCDSVVGISTFNIKNSTFLLYPNPNTGEFSITTKELGKAKMEIYNVAGQLVYSKSLNKQEEKVNLKNQPKGLYLVKVSSGNEIITERMVKF